MPIIANKWQKLSLIDRFWMKVDKSGGPDACWPWLAGINPHGGYGRFRPGLGEEHRSHVFAYELENGPLPDGQIVLHRCDSPPCCNPAHLRAGTHADNVADKVSKGRHTHGTLYPKAKLNEERVAAIRKRHAGGESQKLLAAEFGVDPSIVSQVVNGKKWKHVSKEGVA